jgi:hypothetical protein
MLAVDCSSGLLMAEKEGLSAHGSFLGLEWLIVLPLDVV